MTSDLMLIQIIQIRRIHFICFAKSCVCYIKHVKGRFWGMGFIPKYRGLRGLLLIKFFSKLRENFCETLKTYF